MTVKWSRRKYTKEQFSDAVAVAQSYAEVARILNLNRHGGTYETIRTGIDDLKLDISHMTGQGWNKGDKLGLSKRNTIPLDEILVKNSAYINTSALKKKLYHAGLKQRKCEWCGITEWNGKPAPLALDHINGIRTDNRIENLRILCYNCHGQTITYGGNNKKLKAM